MFLLTGTAGLILAFGAFAAEAQSVLDRVESSPRALQSSDVGSLLRPSPLGSILSEGRSAFVGGAGGFNAQNNGNGSIKNAAPISQDFDAPSIR
jgi:hypothetical protein